MARTLSIEDLNANVNRMVGALHTEMEQINISLAQTAVPLITQRLVNEGKTAEGQSLGQYSTRPMSALFFIGKSLGSGADKSVADYAKKNKGKISYEKFRELNGRPTSHVTLSFSGETLADIGVIKTSTNGAIVTTTVGSLDRKKKDIINAKGKKTGEISTGEVLANLNQKYGNALDTELLALSQQETEIITEIYAERVQEFLDKYFQ